MFTIEAILAALELESLGEDRHRAEHVKTKHNVVFGGQLLAQSIVAGTAGQEGKTVKTLHTVFARAARPDAPVEITVERLHAGRAFASSSVTISQGDRLCTRSTVLLTADEPDLIRHGDSPATASSPDDATPGSESGASWEVRTVGDVDLRDPDAVGPADLDVWTRFVGVPEEPVVNQALLAFATDGFLIATAMRPHKGVGQSMAHVSIDTGVISHTITFHEPCAAGEWNLLSHHVPYAGRGRSYGTANIFDADGGLVASFVQDNMIRAMAPKTPRPA